MTAPDPQLALSALGWLFVAYLIFSAGRWFERVRAARRARQVPRKTREKPERGDNIAFRSPEEVSNALAAEINKGKKADPDRVEFLLGLTQAGKLRVVK